MFYHALIETSEKLLIGYKQICDTDLSSLETIIDTLVIPYCQGNKINIKGYQIQSKDIRRLLITESEASIETIIKKKNRHSFPVTIFGPYTEQQVIRCSYTKDITKKALQLADEKIKSNLKTHNTQQSVSSEEIKKSWKDNITLLTAIIAFITAIVSFCTKVNFFP